MQRSYFSQSGLHTTCSTYLVRQPRLPFPRRVERFQNVARKRRYAAFASAWHAANADYERCGRPKEGLRFND
jgi:hypothetical protein